MDQKLQHSGVLGMKWGKHIFVDHPSEYKSGAESASKFASAAKESHKNKQETKAKAVAKAKAKQLSDEELRQKVNRMNLEEQYAKLSTAQMERGKDAISSFLGATTTVLNVAASALTVAVAVKQLSSLSTAAKAANAVAAAT